MRNRLLIHLGLILPLIASPASTEEDFSFFALIKDGKIAKEKINAHCADLPRALSMVGTNVTHNSSWHQRVAYHDKQVTNLNANPGEWTGSVYKTLCPGLYSFTLDYLASELEGGTNDDFVVHLHVWRKDGSQDRPGDLTAVAYKTGPGGRSTGHASVTLEMATGDEFSTFSFHPDDAARHFERIQLTAYRVHHIPSLAKEFNLKVWNSELASLAQVPGAEAQ